MDDLISRQAAIDAAALSAAEWDGMYVQDINGRIREALEKLSSAQPEPHEIGYSECANAMLKMWVDNVLTDGEYNRIMDKLNAHWTERREE